MPGVFATLRPANVAAQLAYHHAVESTLPQSQLQQAPAHHALFMRTESAKKLDRAVAHVLEKRQDTADSDYDPTEPDTDTETPLLASSAIWMGEYTFDLSTRDALDNTWIAGRGRPPTIGTPAGCQFLLASKDNSVRGHHVRFSIDNNTGFLSLMAYGYAAKNIRLNGKPVEERVVLNQHTAYIHIQQLEYKFSYTEHS